MRESNLRSRITTSTATLPVVAILCGTIWAANLDTTPTGTGVVALVAVMTYLMVELNARHALLRVRSRMVSTMFLLVVTALPWALTLTEALTATALTAMLFPLFAVYQGGRRPGLVYYMGVCLAIGSMAYPPMLLLSLPLLAAMAIFLRVLNARHFFALLFGMVTPYWIAAAWGLWQGCADAMADQWLQQWTFTAPCYDALPAPAITGAALIAGISVPAIVHTLRTAYNDKIRTRMYFYTLTVLHLTLLGALAAQPQHYAMLLPLLTVTTAPLAAHHFTLSRGRSALLWFIICLTAIAAVIVGKICMLHGIVR